MPPPRNVGGPAGRASAARKALTALDAVDAPTGRLPVVVGSGFGGVLLHEAVGHGLEADAVQKRASVYAGRLGERLADARVSAYDDGRRPGAWGSDGIDDEGTPTQAAAIPEEGRLASYLYDLVRARRDGVASTGNGRRESFRHLPLPRMTNTYFAPGEATAQELIAEVPRDLYAVSFGGGQVEPATGDFVFGVSEGYLIEGGRVTAPMRGATLVGNADDGTDPEGLASAPFDGEGSPRRRTALVERGRLLTFLRYARAARRAGRASTGSAAGALAVARREQPRARDRPRQP